MPGTDPSDPSGILLHKAAGDEAAVARLVPDAGILDEIVGFHAQQAVEKRVKAVLVARGIDYAYSHNLGYRLDLLRSNGVEGPPEAEQVKRLTQWAAEFRYADVPHGTLDREATVATVAAVREWSLRILGL